MVVPPDASRPYLTSFQSNEHTDYVNAVFADGYRRADEFICTEWPMHDTMPDFWSMLYDHDIKTVVVLNHQRTSGKYPQFWPDNTSGGGGGGGQRKSFGPVFCVEHESSHEHEGGRFRSFELKLTKHDVAPHRLAIGQKCSVLRVSRRNRRFLSFLSRPPIRLHYAALGPPALWQHNATLGHHNVSLGQILRP